MLVTTRENDVLRSVSAWSVVLVSVLDVPQPGPRHDCLVLNGSDVESFLLGVCSCPHEHL